MKSKGELALFQQIESEQLLGSLIRQLNKDADLSGLDFQCNESILAVDLVNQVYELLVHLMLVDFKTYLNFLYRIDVSERTLREISDTDPKLIAEKVTILVLKREWQKVSFRNRSQ